MNPNGRTPISISNIESSLDAMARRLESSSSTSSTHGAKTRRPRPPPNNLNLNSNARFGTFTAPSSTTSSTSSRLKPSLDLNSHRSNSTNRAGLGLGFHHDSVPLAGLGTVEVDGVQYKNVTERDFCHEDGNNGFLGSGTSGTVFKKKFKNKNVAVKQIAKSDDKDEMKRLRMDLGVMMKSNCSSIVKYLGAVSSDASVWIVMELMLTCFEKVLRTLRMPIEVKVLGSLTVSVVQALNYLKEKHSTIHRDVKPSNILVDYEGRIKLCDFGISGRLVDSQAQTRGAGCAAYLSPERIDPERGAYDVRADIWSLGLTLIELATAQFPYANCKSDFEVCAKILQTEAPQLGPSFPHSMQDFVAKCCIKNVDHRPKYPSLMRHEFYLENHSRLDRDRVVRQWLLAKRLLVNEHPTQQQHGFKPQKTAIHTPQPVSSSFTPVKVQGRENWASFNSNGTSGTSTTNGGINSVSVKIKNNKNQDLISW